MSKKIKPWSANQRKFQQWLALPKSVREPTLQGELAVFLRVNESTLSRWKKWHGLDESGRSETFQEAVNRYAREFLSDDLPDVFAILREKAREGSFQHIKLYLEMLGEYVERHDITSGGEKLGAPTIFLPEIEEIEKVGDGSGSNGSGN